MANAFTYQVLKDTTEHTVIKLTGLFDGSEQEDDDFRIIASGLSGALNANTVPGLLVDGGDNLLTYNLSINRIYYDCYVNGTVKLYWYGPGGHSTIAMLSGNGQYNSDGNWISIPIIDELQSGTITGDIGISTVGMVANSSYTIILELRKHNDSYQRGQFNDPAAFNYPPYNLRP